MYSYFVSNTLTVTFMPLFSFTCIHFFLQSGQHIEPNLHQDDKKSCYDSQNYSGNIRRSY